VCVVCVAYAAHAFLSEVRAAVERLKSDSRLTWADGSNKFACSVLDQDHHETVPSGPPPWAIVSVGRSTELILLLALGFAVVCRRCQLESVRQLPEEAVGQIQVLVGPSSLHVAARWRMYTTPLTDIPYVSTNAIAVVVTRYVVEGD